MDLARHRYSNNAYARERVGRSDTDSVNDALSYLVGQRPL